jgi:hypothetical protein
MPDELQERFIEYIRAMYPFIKQAYIDNASLGDAVTEVGCPLSKHAERDMVDWFNLGLWAFTVRVLWDEDKNMQLPNIKELEQFIEIMWR